MDLSQELDESQELEELEEEQRVDRELPPQVHRLWTRLRMFSHHGLSACDDKVRLRVRGGGLEAARA